MTAGERDRTAAISVLASAADEGHAVERIAEAIAAERERVLAPIRALHRPAYSGWCGHCADISDGDSEAMWPCTTVQVLTQAAASVASPADQPGRKP